MKALIRLDCLHISNNSNGIVKIKASSDNEKEFKDFEVCDDF